MEEKKDNMADVMQFVVFAIESAAQKTGIDSTELYNRLQRLNLVQSALVEGYDMLHTQGRPFIANYVSDTLNNWERQEKEKESNITMGDTYIVNELVNEISGSNKETK